MKEQANTTTSAALPDYLKTRYKGKDLQSSLRVLKLLDKHGNMSQKDVAQKCNATQPFAAMHLKRLRYEGLIKRASRRLPEGGGRPYATWQIDAEVNLFLGMVWYGPEFIMCLADYNGKSKIYERRDVQDVKSQGEVLEIIDAYVQKAMNYASTTQKHVRFAYVGMPGHMDADTGRLLKCVNAPVLVGLDFERHLAERYGLDCMVHAQFGHWFGESQLWPGETVTVINWDQGISLMTGCDGQVFFYNDKPGKRYRGVWDMAHIVVEKDGKQCRCGKRGCLEAYVGGGAICDRLNRKDLPNADALMKAAMQGDPEVIAALNDAAECLGKHLGFYLQFIGTDRLIITGVLSRVFDKFAPHLRKGLATLLNDDYIDAIGPSASVDPDGLMAAGTAEMAKRMFFDRNYFLKMRKESSRFFAQQTDEEPLPMVMTK
ncbi:ROK family transcriptional regulator [Phycisphaerales bacterium AB-hyl4]|uniref:ROK family transcriptional regulator n=1 Tax=Natronomicrosphaera hydrolytica TaxID=3242702 RepID=A0ABV4U9K7_9BACT